MTERRITNHFINNMPAPQRSFAWMMETAWKEALENGIAPEVANPLFAMHIARIQEGKFGICENCGGSIMDDTFDRNRFAVVCKHSCATELLQKEGKVINFNGILYHVLANAVEATITREISVPPFTGRRIFITGLEVKAMSPSMISSETLFLFSLLDGQNHNSLKMRMLADKEDAANKLRLNFPHRDIQLLV